VLGALASIAGAVRADEPAIGAGATSAISAAPEIPLVDQAELLEFLAGADSFVLIDARTADEYSAGHIARAVNVPHDAVEDSAAALPAGLDTPIVVYCKTGRRSSTLRDALLARGYMNVRVLGPRQIFWTPTAPVFNCGVPADTAPPFLPENEESPSEVKL
jgi:phage shock protein E